MQLPAHLRAFLLEVLRELLEKDEYEALVQHLEKLEKENCDTCDCGNCDLVDELHHRPLFVISSAEYQSLDDALDQLKEWFEDGVLDPYAAVYRVSNGPRSFFVISSTEFDTREEAQEQIYEWHRSKLLDSRSQIYETSLSDCFELDLTLVRAIK